MAPVFLALVLATLTVFVRDPWASLGFQALTCAILARSAPRPHWILILPLFGITQLLTGSTIYQYATILSTLHWLSLCAVFLLARQQGANVNRFLDWFLAFATLESVLCLAQIHTSSGRILWLIPSGYDDYVYGTFTSYNNFAQFAELAIPVAIVLAFERPGRALWYTGATGLLYAAVIASTSRTGAILATGELVAVPLIMTYLHRGAGRRQAGLLLAAVPAFAMLWTAAAGWERLAQRFAAGDLAAGRKEFLLSALGMIAERPLAGHGLGTWELAYPRFARIDLAESVNHAHNDWAEFAAEGGIGFALLILALFVWATPRLSKSPWALGIFAVLIHAAVDYPFPRPGVSGWLFGLFGLLTATPAATAAKRNWLVTATGAAGAVAALWFMTADLNFQRDTPQAVRRAAAMAPSNAGYWLRLAALANDEAALETALAVNPHDARILVESGLRADWRGDYATAERLLLEAAKLDPGWLPRWTLANFYASHGREGEFWRWARSAAAHGARADLTPLFRLASRMADDFSERLLPDRAEVLRAYTAFAIRENRLQGLESACARLIAAGEPNPDRNYAVACAERFLSRKDPRPALRLWQALIAKGWLDGGPGFTATPLNEGFDWRLSPGEGVTIAAAPGSLAVTYSGSQPDDWPALQKLAAVQPGLRYRLRATYEGEQLRNPAGLRWRIVNESSWAILAEGPLDQELEFQPKGADLIRVQLLSVRPRGATKTSGTVRFTLVEWRPIVSP